MRIIVVGTGDLGFHVAKRFSEEHHDVVVVGRDDEALHWAQEVLDVSAVRGHGGSPSVLLEAGVKSADVVVAATEQRRDQHRRLSHQRGHRAVRHSGRAPA